jgi:hypothetical protein
MGLRSRLSRRIGTSKCRGASYMYRSLTDPQKHNDWRTVAAIALLAMCLVTFDHEALGHGGMCLALGGHIRILTSSIFQCDIRSVWIDPAGPFSDCFVGAVSILLARVTSRRSTRTRLFLIIVASLSFFWEAGYLIQAMRVRKGDLYGAGQDFFGEPSLWWRTTGVVVGIGFYAFVTRWASRRLSDLWPSAVEARRVAITVWVTASLGAILAALAYSGDGWADLRDATLEISVSSFPLLFIPRRSRGEIIAANVIAPSGITICLSLIVYAIFVETLGRGLR